MAKKLSKKDIQGLYILCSVGVVLLSIAVLFIYLNSKLPKENFCIDNYTGRSYHTVIIDKTDDFNDGIIEAIRNYFNSRLQVKASDQSVIKIQDMVTIYILDEENFNKRIHAVPKPFLSLCNPGNDPNVIVEGPRFVRDNYNKFVSELDMVYTNLRRKGSASQSPIFEMIKSASENIIDPNKSHIYVISDMLHNNDFYSQHRSNHTFKDYKKVYSDYYRTIKPSINGATINVLYLRRDRYRNHQSLEHEEFWKKYFMDNNAKAIYFTRL